MDKRGQLVHPDMSRPEIDSLLEWANSMSDTTIMGKMGLEFTDAGYDFFEGTMPVEGNTQPAGLFHGGAHVVLAETLGSTHAFARAGTDVVGLDLNATHVRAAKSGLVHGRAEVIHAGRTIINHEVRMTDDDGRLLSIVRITNLVLQPKD